MFMLSALDGGSLDEVTAVVACEVAVEAAVLADSGDDVLLLVVWNVGDLGVGSGAESFVFFFLRRLPNVGIDAEKGGLRGVGRVTGQPEAREYAYWSEK